MDQLLSAKFEAGTHRSEMNVRAGSLARHGFTEGEVRNVFGVEIIAQPDTLGLVGIQRDIHAAAMIEPERAVCRGIAHGAHRQLLAEFLLEGGLDSSEDSIVEDAVAIVSL